MKLSLLFATILNLRAECKFCISENKAIVTEARKFLELAPSDQLVKIEKEGVKVFILKSDKENTVPFFQWKKIRVDQGKLTDISKLEGSLGKTLCKGEKPIAQNEYTIVLNSDAPMSTLLHEYLHVKQIINDKSWCQTSKRLWETQIPDPRDIKIVRDHEWDVRQILWQLRDHKSFNVEDHIVIAEGMLKESEMRKEYDPDAQKIIKDEKVNIYLTEQIEEYKKNLLKQFSK